MVNFEKLIEENGLEVYQNYLRNEILEKISELMEKKNIKKAELSRRLNVSRAEVTRLLSNERNMEINTIAKIFYNLGEELKVLTKNEYNSEIKHFKREKLTYKVSSKSISLRSKGIDCRMDSQKHRFSNTAIIIKDSAKYGVSR